MHTDPVDNIIFDDWSYTRERNATAPRPCTVPDKWFGGRTRVADAILRGHPTRADEKLRRF